MKSDLDFLKKKVSFISSKITARSSQEFTSLVDTTPMRSTNVTPPSIIRPATPLELDTMSTPPTVCGARSIPPLAANVPSQGTPLANVSPQGMPLAHVSPQFQGTAANVSSQVTLANDGSDTQESDKELIPPDRLTQIFVKSCSRPNFATNLVRELFTKEVRKRSNVAGKKKDKLDAAKMEYVKSTVFKYHPCTQMDKMPEVWKECIRLIDESNRRLNKKV